MFPHLCTSSLELIFSDDEFGHDAEHTRTLKHKQQKVYGIQYVYVMLPNGQNVVQLYSTLKSLCV